MSEVGVLPDDLDTLPEAEQIAKLKEAVAALKEANTKKDAQLEEFKDVVKRVKLIIREAQQQFTDLTPISELKEALLAQATAAGKTREEVESSIDKNLEAAEKDPVVKKGLVSYLNSEFNKTSL